VTGDNVLCKDLYLSAVMVDCLAGEARRRRQREIECFKAECCKVCIVLFSLMLIIVLVTF